MLHKELWGLTLLGFIFWIIMASSPTERIERVCKPVAWTGNVTTSLAALVTPQFQTASQDWFNKLNYGCEYTVWRLFYQQAYNAQQQRNMSVAPTVSTTPAAAATAKK